MQEELTSVIEPIVTPDYLDSASEKTEEITDLLETDLPILVKPQSLANSPYYLQIHKRIETPKQTQILMKIVKDDGSDVNGGTTGILMLEPGEAKVTGSYDNHSHHRLAGDIPIRNFSGVTAPYEDAICLLFSSKIGTSVTRVVTTCQPEKSRFVQNYTNRGFDLEDLGTRIRLHKQFSSV